MSVITRAIAITAAAAVCLGGLVAGPVAASPASQPSVAAKFEIPESPVLPEEPPHIGDSSTSGTGEPHSFRHSDTNFKDIPAKVKKAKKKTKTLVILAYSKKKDSTTPKKLKKTFFTDVDRWMRWESSGRQGETGKTTKWLKISKTSCSNFDGVMKKAIAKAKRAGYNVNGFTRIAVYFPKCSKLPWDGLGTVGKDRGKYYIWLNGNPSLQVVAHEALHNYGLLHSASTDCNGRSWPKSTSGCTVSPYGDPFDVMGNTDIAMSASSKFEAGWLTKKQYRTIKKGSKTFTINANESASGKLKLVRVAMGKKKYLEIEYRVPGGLDTGLDDRSIARPSFSGVQVRAVKPHKNTAQFGRTIVDVLPNNPAYFASIPAGQSWTAYNRARITVVSTSPTQAVVTVTFKAPSAGVPATPVTPVLSLVTPPASPTVRGAGQISLAPVDGNGMPVLAYNIELTNGSQSIPATYDAVGGLAIAVPNIPYGSYQVRVQAANEVGVGPWSAWSAPLVLTEPLPVLGATSVDSGSVPKTFTWRQFAAVVTPSPSTGSPISQVYLSNTYSGGRNGGCYAVLKAGTTDTWVCPEDYYSGYQLFTGPNTLTVEAIDALGHYTYKTVNFTVNP